MKKFKLIFAMLTIFMALSATKANAQINLFEIITSPTEASFVNDEEGFLNVSATLNPLTVLGDLARWEARFDGPVPQINNFDIVILNGANPGEKIVTVAYRPGDTPPAPFAAKLVITAKVSVLFDLITVVQEVPVSVISK